MELILQTGLEHQQRPVDAIADVLHDVHIEQPSQFYENPCIDLTDVNILSNYNRQNDLYNFVKRNVQKSKIFASV